MAGCRGPILGRRQEFQCGAIDAVSKAGRFWAVLEDVALMALATSAMDFRAGKNQFEVRTRLDDFWIDRLPETRPACAAVKLMLG